MRPRAYDDGVQLAMKPLTVVTQFLTDHGTDTGKLVEISRLSVQDGKPASCVMFRWIAG